jgi:hypothetical protein
MGSFKHPRIYDPLDLEILDHIYEVAWARFEATAPRRDLARDAQRKDALRKLVLALASSHPVDFDELLDKLDAVPASWLRDMAEDASPSA